MRPGAFAQYALHMLDGGYSPIPIKEGTKRPLFNQWDHLKSKAMAPIDISALSRRSPNLGLGVAGGFNCLVPIDIDTNDKAIRSAVLGSLPKPTVAKAGARGFTLFYWDMSGMIEAAKFKRPLGDGKFEMLVEIINTGQTVLPPTIHPETKMPYRWLTRDTLFNTMVDELPELSIDHINAMEKALSPWMPEQRRFEPKLVPENAGQVSDSRRVAYARAILTRCAKELSGMGANSGRNQALFIAACKIGKYIHHGIITQAEVQNALLGACQANGLISDDGPDACRASLRSGLGKAVNDQLPALQDRERRSA